MAYKMSGAELEKAKKAKLGTGERFRAVASNVEKSELQAGKSPKEAARIAGATAAKIGRKSLGAKKFNQLAVAGRERQARKARMAV